MNTVEHTIMGLNIAHTGDLKKTQETFDSKQKSYKDLVDKINSDMLKLLDSRKMSIKYIAELDDYVSKLDNCPESVIAGAHRAVCYTSAIKEEWAKIEAEYYATINDSGFAKGKKSGTAAAAGAAAAGSAFATFGPSAAMAIATTFGTASTGAAISGLGGAAAVNAALAWLGGGAVAAGGAGIAGGTTMLALFGPIGWSIAAVSVAGGLFLSSSKNKKRIKEIDEEIDKLEVYIKQLKNKRTQILTLQGETEKLTKEININNLAYLGCSNFNSEKFPKKELFSIVDSAKLLGKMTQERI